MSDQISESMANELKGHDLQIKTDMSGTCPEDEHTVYYIMPIDDPGCGIFTVPLSPSFRTLAEVETWCIANKGKILTALEKDEMILVCHKCGESHPESQMVFKNNWYFCDKCREDKFEGMYFTQPQPFSRYHIFDKNDRSLCGKWAMFTKNKDLCTDVTGKETFRDGDDCKLCFRKAKLRVD